MTALGRGYKIGQTNRSEVFCEIGSLQKKKSIVHSSQKEMGRYLHPQFVCVGWFWFELVVSMDTWLDFDDDRKYLLLGGSLLFGCLFHGLLCDLLGCLFGLFSCLFS